MADSRTWRNPDAIRAAAAQASSQRHLAKLLGASSGSAIQTMKRIAAAHGIALPLMTAAARERRRLEAQTFDLFDLAIDEHAYLLGLLQTDGHLQGSPEGRGKLTIELAAKDVELLERVRAILPCRSALRFRERQTNFGSGQRTATLAVYNLEVRRELARRGMPVGRKSVTVGPPADPLLNVRGYIRGLWDGDGSVGVTSRGYPFMAFVTKSPLLSEFVLDHIAAVTGRRYTASPNRRDGVMNISIFRHEALAFSSWLYQHGDLAMERKATAVRSFTEWQRTRRAGPRRSWTADDDAVALAMPLREAAAALGRTLGSVSARRHRLRRGIQ